MSQSLKNTMLMHLFLTNSVHVSYVYVLPCQLTQMVACNTIEKGRQVCSTWEGETERKRIKRTEISCFLGPF